MLAMLHDAAKAQLAVDWPRYETGNLLVV